MASIIAEETTTSAKATVYSMSDKEVSLRLESSTGRISYLDILVVDLPMVMAALSAADLNASKATA
jgi:hypothetical protein